MLSSVRAFTLIELLISSILLIAMMGVVFQFALRGQEMARQETRIGVLEGKAMQIMEGIADEIRFSGATQIVPSDPVGNETQLQFLRVEALDPTGADAHTYAADPLTYSLVLAPGELQNQMDDNDDGLTDELILVRISDERDDNGDLVATVIATGIKGFDDDTFSNVSGFRMRRATGSDRLRMVIELQQADRYGKVYEASYGTSISLRNP